MFLHAGPVHRKHRIKGHQVQKVRGGMLERHFQRVVVEHLDPNLGKIEQDVPACFRAGHRLLGEQARLAFDLDLIHPAPFPLRLGQRFFLVRGAGRQVGLRRFFDA